MERGPGHQRENHGAFQAPWPHLCPAPPAPHHLPCTARGSARGRGRNSGSRWRPTRTRLGPDLTAFRLDFAHGISKLPVKTLEIDIKMKPFLYSVLGLMSSATLLAADAAA